MGTIEATPNADRSYVRLVIQFNPAVTQIQIGRIDPTGFTDIIRAGTVVDLSGGAVVVYDYEAPLDLPVTYTATQVTPATTTPETARSAEVTLASNTYTWLKDPGLPTRNQRLDEVKGIASLTRPARAGVFHIIDRTHPIVVSARREGRVGELVFHTATDIQREAMVTLLSRGTVLLLQTPANYGFGSAYVHVSDALEERVGILGSEPTRRWTLPITMVDRPAGLATLPIWNTWANVASTYATWSDLVDTGKTWYQVAEGT